MLKIPKGLKKKKKDKKHKRKGEEELFDEKELEQYRKEHQHQQGTETSENSIGENVASSSEKGEEWKKFNALTAGIDNILQKTQEDLDRIKSTSFFQRKAPPPPPPPPTSEAEKKEERVVDDDKKKKKKPKPKVVEENATTDPEAVQDQPAEVEEDLEASDTEESADEFVEDVDIFDTEYVDAVTSGELKLAYIPDSPVLEEQDYDPFDTHFADKFIESNPKKRYLNLGCAVQVLSGNKTTGCNLTTITLDKRPKRRVKPVDLLLSSFDEGSDPPPDIPQGIEKYLSSDSPVKTLLDDGLIFDESELALPPAPAVTPVPATTPTPAPPPTVATTPQLDFSEFETDIITTAIVAQQSVESIDDEFERLAAESLTKKLPTATKELAPPNSIGSLTHKVSPNFDHSSPISPIASQHEPDPFDTTVADKHLLPGKQEINLLEKELLETGVQLSQLEDDDFDPRADTPPPEPPPDILTRSPEGETCIFKPLTPRANSPEDDLAEDHDPFDTSHVNGAPGKLELKLIEKELAAADFEDNDFDPRKNQPKITEVILNKYNVTQDTENKTEEIYIDILTGDSKSHEVDEFVPTVQPRKLSDTDEVDEVDPFDTSIAENIAPGKTELKILENELIN